jgi:uncharacterized membrane protein YiaA
MDWITTNANAIMAITAVLTLVGGLATWFLGLWGSRKPASKNTAKSGGVIVEGNVKGDITTNPSRKRKK